MSWAGELGGQTSTQSQESSPATKNWPGGLESDNPKNAFENLQKEVREAIYRDFESQLPGIREIWNDPESQIKSGGRITRTLGGVWRKLFRETAGQVIENTASQMDAGMYVLGIKSLEAHRRVRGSNRIAPAPKEWKTVNWGPYDHGGSLSDTVDFLYWIDGNLVRPPDRYILDQLGVQP